MIARTREKRTRGFKRVAGRASDASIGRVGYAADSSIPRLRPSESLCSRSGRDRYPLPGYSDKLDNSRLPIRISTVAKRSSAAQRRVTTHDVAARPAYPSRPCRSCCPETRRARRRRHPRARPQGRRRARLPAERRRPQPRPPPLVRHRRSSSPTSRNQFFAARGERRAARRGRGGLRACSSASSAEHAASTSTSTRCAPGRSTASSSTPRARRADPRRAARRHQRRAHRRAVGALARRGSDAEGAGSDGGGAPARARAPAAWRSSGRPPTSTASACASAASPGRSAPRASRSTSTLAAARARPRWPAGTPRCARSSRCRRAPTAVFCANDLIALGALQGLRAGGRLGSRRRCRIVGCDDIEFAQLVTPELTTIAVPARELGARAARLLVRELAGDPAPPSQPRDRSR